MVLSFDILRVVALYGWVKGSLLGAVIWLQEAVVLPLSMHFCLSGERSLRMQSFEDVEEHIIHFS
jgi:hypothetical protein